MAAGGPIIDRARLLRTVADRRHPDRRLTVLEAPGGAGKSVLVTQALAASAPHPGRDVVVAADDGRDGLVAVLAPLGRDPTPTCLVLDQVERLDEAAGAALADLVADAPDHVHLLLAGRSVPPIGLPALLAAGRAVLLDADDLALRPSEVTALAAALHAEPPADAELAGWPALAGLVLRGHDDHVGAYLRELLDATCAPSEARLLAAAALVGGLDGDGVAVVADALGHPGAVASSWPLPLVDTVPDGLWPHPVWATAVDGLLDRPGRDAAAHALATALLGRGEVVPAGDLAAAHGDGAVLAAAVRAALATAPPRVHAAVLARWTEGLAPGSVEERWARATATPPQADAHPDAPLHAIRAEMAASGDTDGEVAVILLLGQRARQRRDPAALLPLIERSRALVAAGVDAARPLAALGDAVFRQLEGDHDGAVAALGALTPRDIRSDLGAQVLMVRGANLLLTGRVDVAITALTTATGIGSPWSRAVAGDLLGAAHWAAGDATAAIDAAQVAGDLAGAQGAPRDAARAHASAACYLAASGAPEAADAVAGVARLRHDDHEAGQLATLAAVLLASGRGDLDEARRLLAALPARHDGARASAWRLALETALATDDVDPDADDRDDADAGGSAGSVGPSRPSPRAVGAAARRHLAGGPPVAREGMAFLPAVWCRPPGPRVDVRLLGAGTVRRVDVEVDRARWGRGRVRELCLHLAVVTTASRPQVAAALWPDLDHEAAGANLRVTLNHLLDVLDPERPRRGRSAVLVDDPQVLALAGPPVVHVDVRRLLDAAERLVAGHRQGDGSVTLSAGRRLAELGVDVPLVGTEVGRWWDGPRADLCDRVAGAAIVGAGAATDEGLPDLAAALGAVALRFEPWDEAGHRAVIGARLQAGDPDGARRAARRALAVLRDVGGPVDPETVRAIRRTGVRIH